jgi:high-affinity nickel-transport protein
MWTLWIGYLFGLGQGVRHALEPDHLAAVSTVVATQRSVRASVFFAICWGLGHCLMLLAVGGPLFLARRQVPAPFGLVFELAVAAMLVSLGLRGLWYARASLGGRGFGGHRAPHVGAKKIPPSVGPSVGRGLRPLAIGVVHGLAGSGALTILVASNYRSALAGLLFIAVYGLGATMGMALLAGAVGLPFARVMQTRFGPTVLLGATGILSLVLGLLWGWPALQGVAVQ